MIISPWITPIPWNILDCMDWFWGWGCSVDVESLSWDGLLSMWVSLMSVGSGGGVSTGSLVDGFWVSIPWFGLLSISVN